MTRKVTDAVDQVPLPGLVPVTGPVVCAALDRSGARNPLLGMAVDAAAGRPAADWGRPAVDGPARELVDAVGTWLGGAPPRVAASMVVLGYAARLVGPAVAVLLRNGVLLDLRPGNVRFGYDPRGGFRLTTVQPAGWQGRPDALVPGWAATVLDGHLAAVVAAVRSTVPVAAGLLWGNVASGVAGALAALVRDGTVPVAEAYARGGELLACGPLRDAGELSMAGGGLRFVRRSCCLYYRLDGGGLCADCALQPAARVRS